MLATVITAAGAAPVVDTVADPLPAEGQIVADVLAVGIHPIVRALAGTEHYASTGRFPLTPGGDAVVRLPDGSLGYTAVFGGAGTMSERIAISPRAVFPLPADADPRVVAAGVNPGMSSWLPLVMRVEELAGAPLGTVVVLGATGVAGRLAVQNAFQLGASRVIAVGRDADRLAETAAFGAVTVPLTGDTESDAAAVRAAIGEEDPTTIIDFVWGSTAEVAFAALQKHGAAEVAGSIVHIEIGSMAGADARVPAELLRSRRYTIVGSGAGSMPMARLMAEAPGYLARLADGSLSVPFTAYPLADVAAAWASGPATRAVITMPAA